MATATQCNLRMSNVVQVVVRFNYKAIMLQHINSIPAQPLWSQNAPTYQIPAKLNSLRQSYCVSESDDGYNDEHTVAIGAADQ